MIFGEALPYFKEHTRRHFQGKIPKKYLQAWSKQRNLNNSK